ncbi:hypothetical protein E3J74_08500 [Candidatus Bathyarchaeota archaeon]|nr:MAG: hypothetical protein E3J74_08500 [Candidatus Bathyarchaeota archaeon]
MAKTKHINQRNKTNVTKEKQRAQRKNPNRRKKVQGVGYRLFLLQKALENGIQKFYTRNINTNKIEPLLSDERTKINRFYETIKKEKPKQATVNHIKKEQYNNKIPIPTIDRYLNFLALEQLTKGREEVSTIGEKIRNSTRTLQNRKRNNRNPRKNNKHTRTKNQKTRVRPEDQTKRLYQKFSNPK